jgi:hypothetical protein
MDCCIDGTAISPAVSQSSKNRPRAMHTSSLVNDMDDCGNGNLVIDIGLMEYVGQDNKVPEKAAWNVKDISPSGHIVSVDHQRFEVRDLPDTELIGIDDVT